MSKIGKKEIPFSSVKVEVDGKNVVITGAKNKIVHTLPDALEASIDGNALKLSLVKDERAGRVLWGLHRALLANKIQGLEKGFELPVKIVGLGYKAQISGKKMTFSLGYSHKIDYELPQGVDVTIDKTGQQLVFKSYDKELLGTTCDAIRKFKLPEPYKGTGILRAGDIIIRKAGKKSA